MNSPSSLSGLWPALIIATALTVLAFQVSTAYRREIIHYDEGYYLCEARGLRELIQAVPDLLRHPHRFSEWKASIRRKGAILPPGNGKPTFILFLALASMLPIRGACAGDLLTISGCFTGVACFFFLCRKFGHSILAALALSLLFLVSPIWNYYSVTTLSNPLSAAILLGGILCYIGGKWFRACLLFGVSFTVHYSAIAVAGILLCAMAVELWLRPVPGQDRWLESAKCAAGLSFPFFVWQVFYCFRGAAQVPV